MPVHHTPLRYALVDVFSPRPYGGNSLAVFEDARGLTAEQMLRITQELRYFETIFLEPPRPDGAVPARVFDLVEELPFAGHPIIGAAGVLHRSAGACGETIRRFALGKRIVEVCTDGDGTAGGSVTGTLDQGRPDFGSDAPDRDAIAASLSLGMDDLDPDLPPQVVSTGLCYLVVPVRDGVLGRARIASDLGPLLAPIGANYAILLDDAGPEVRHWVNDGSLEDVATGSAAGCIGAYRLRHGRAAPGATFALAQGRYAGRPSTLRVTPHGRPGDVERVEVGGDVAFVGTGALDVLP